MCCSGSSIRYTQGRSAPRTPSRTCGGYGPDRAQAKRSGRSTASGIPRRPRSDRSPIVRLAEKRTAASWRSSRRRVSHSASWIQTRKPAAASSTAKTAPSRVERSIRRKRPGARPLHQRRDLAHELVALGDEVRQGRGDLAAEAPRERRGERVHPRAQASRRRSATSHWCPPAARELEHDPRDDLLEARADVSNEVGRAIARGRTRGQSSTSRLGP